MKYKLPVFSFIVSVSFVCLVRIFFNLEVIKIFYFLKLYCLLFTLIFTTHMELTFVYGVRNGLTIFTYGKLSQIAFIVNAVYVLNIPLLF